jgi:hypothetical protein
MPKKFKVTLEIITKEDFSIADIQRYYRQSCYKNGDLESYSIKTEVLQKSYSDGTDYKRD